MADAWLIDAQHRQPGRVTAGKALDLAQRLPRVVLEARRVTASIAGVHGRRRAGPGETFWQFRPLGSGESAARIDWRRSARDGKLFVREREWEAAHTVHLWIDRSASMGFASHLAKDSKVDRALVTGLALAEVLVEAGERVAYLGLTTPSASPRIIEKLAEAMAGDAQGMEADMPPALPLSPQSEAIIITDALSDVSEWADRIATIASRGGKGHLALIADPVEETFPFSGQAELFDLEAGLKLRVGDTAMWREDYLKRLQSHREALLNACTRSGWTMMIHRTDKLASTMVLTIAERIAAARHRI
jgi:uncharacterized protein (DUF58 family)